MLDVGGLDHGERRAGEVEQQRRRALVERGAGCVTAPHRNRAGVRRPRSVIVATLLNASSAFRPSAPVMSTAAMSASLSELRGHVPQESDDRHEHPHVTEHREDASVVAERLGEHRIDRAVVVGERRLGERRSMRHEILRTRSCTASLAASPSLPWMANNMTRSSSCSTRVGHGAPRFIEMPRITPHGMRRRR